MSLTRVFRTTRGFTLIELLVVIVIIGILATSLIPKVMGGPAKARDVARVSQLNQLTTIIQSYYTDYGVYPPATAGECLSSSSATGAILVSGGYVDGVSFPKDPSANAAIATTPACSNGQLFYKSLTRNGLSNQAFVVAARVENTGRANATAATISNDTTVETVLSHLTPNAGNIYAMTGG